MSVLEQIVKENRKSLQPPAAASHFQAKNINTTPFCKQDLSCWPNLLQSVLEHVFGSLYFKRKQTTFPLPEIYYCWCCRHEESIVRRAFASHLAAAQNKTTRRLSVGPRNFWSQCCNAGKHCCANKSAVHVTNPVKECWFWALSRLEGKQKNISTQTHWRPKCFPLFYLLLLYHSVSLTCPLHQWDL